MYELYFTFSNSVAKCGNCKLSVMLDKLNRTNLYIALSYPKYNNANTATMITRVYR